MNFRKIVAHLAYSPAMIWHLAAYDTKIKSDRTNNFKIIFFAILNLMIIGASISTSNHHPSSTTPGLNTSPTNASLSGQLLLTDDHKIKNFSASDFFNDINQKTQLTQVYSYFGLNLGTVQHIKPTQPTSVFANCQEINYSPINTLGQIDITNNLTVYTHPCQSRYYGLSLLGKKHDQSQFIILNNGNLLLPNVDINTTKSLEFKISVVNSTTNTSDDFTVAPGQSLKYTVIATNNSDQAISDVVKINLNDISEYGRVLNNSLTSDQAIYWSIDNLAAGHDESYEIYVKADHFFSQQSLNVDSPTSHDCQISLAVGMATVSNRVACAPLKQAELLIHKTLPPSRFDHKISIAILFSLLAIVILKVLHIARINFISKEIRIIRHKINQGII